MTSAGQPCAFTDWSCHVTRCLCPATRCIVSPRVPNTYVRHQYLPISETLIDISHVMTLRISCIISLPGALLFSLSLSPSFSLAHFQSSRSISLSRLAALSLELSILKCTTLPEVTSIPSVPQLVLPGLSPHPSLSKQFGQNAYTDVKVKCA